VHERGCRNESIGERNMNKKGQPLTLKDIFDRQKDIENG
jgi:hypothetical protein